MKVVCAWCRKVMKDGPDNPVSHGICEACLKKQKGVLRRFNPPVGYKREEK